MLHLTDDDGVLLGKRLQVTLTYLGLHLSGQRREGVFITAAATGAFSRCPRTIFGTINDTGFGLWQT